MKTRNRLLPLILLSLISIGLSSCEDQFALDDHFNAESLKAIGVIEPIENGVTMFGPETFFRATKRPIMELREIEIPDDEYLNDTFELLLINGDINGDYRITSAVVKINNEMIFKPSDFSEQVDTLRQFLVLTEDITLSVELRGKPMHYVELKLLGEKISQSSASGTFTNPK